MIIPARCKDIKRCSKARQKHIMHTKKVHYVGDLKETVFLQCVEHIIKNPGDGHPHISPQPFNSVKVQMCIRNGDCQNEIRCLTAVYQFHTKEHWLFECYKLSQDITFDCVHFFQRYKLLCLFHISGTWRKEHFQLLDLHEPCNRKYG